MQPPHLLAFDPSVRSAEKSDPPDSPSSEAFLSEPSFESLLRQLSALVEHLEKGEIPLEEALRLYETGIHLSRKGIARLEQAERLIEILQKDPQTGEETRRPHAFTDLSGRRNP